MRFIPENINISLDESTKMFIKKFKWDGNCPKFIFSDKIQFADSGQNFESVKCPLCKENIMEWWGSAMSSAYSDEHGFVNLNIATPCCASKASLHTLEYSLPQGFYKTMIEITPNARSEIVPEEIVQNLLDVIGERWRVIYAHY